MKALVMPPVAQTMKKDFPEVRMQQGFNFGTPKIIYNKSFKDDGFALVDPNFFSIFTFPMIKGDPKTALHNPMQLYLHKKLQKNILAKKNQ